MERLVYNQWHVSKCQNCSHLLCTPQQSEKQQVSNCCVLKSIMEKKKTDEKKYDGNQNMEVDIQNRYHTGFTVKNSFTVNQTTQ